MFSTRKILSYSIFLLILTGILAFTQQTNERVSINILSHTVDLRKQKIEFFSEKDNGEKIKSFKALRELLAKNNKKLIFAMNGGIFMQDYTPLGLYIENGVVKHKLNKKKNGYGNFYLQPNGIFYLTNDNHAKIETTDRFVNKNIKYATQSGPMLLINGKINSKFRKDSNNLNIRNGVGILPDGRIVFAMSKERVNFYDFANYFKSLGCRNALYFDGFVSKTYLPAKGYTNLTGNFGVIIAEIL
jgi:uncharacterized protein YigE (DUF2233 family)